MSIVLLTVSSAVIMSSPSDYAKYDDGTEEAFDEADEEANVHVKRYYESLTLDDIGRGFFHRALETFHIGPNIPTDRDFYASPRSLDEIMSPERTPLDHPLRAIAWVLNDAPANTIIRVFCYRLTDPVAIDLLIHAGATKTVQVILHDNTKTRIALKEFVDMYGAISKKTLLENVEIRLANQTGTTSCASRNVQMHDKCVITDNYTTFGSYNLSAFARVGNWESITVVDTRQVHKDRFDAIWLSISTRQLEKYYRELDFPTKGPKRRRRDDDLALVQSDAKRQAT